MIDIFGEFHACAPYMLLVRVENVFRRFCGESDGFARHRVRK